MSESEAALEEPLPAEGAGRVGVVVGGGSPHDVRVALRQVEVDGGLLVEHVFADEARERLLAVFQSDGKEGSITFSEQICIQISATTDK